MTFSELVAEVYELTRRPDRVAETESAVKSATLTAHHSDYFFKDIFEVGVNMGASAYLQQLDYRAVLPTFRAIKYLRKYDYANSTPGAMLNHVLPEQVFDKYMLQKPDIFYVAGAYIQINSSTQEQYFLMGAYKHPVITTAGYDSWIALDHPYAIIYNAAATVFKAIGKDEEAAAFRQLVSEQIGLLKMSNVQPAGF